MTQRAQEILSRKLGILEDGKPLLEDKLKQYFDLFKGPLPLELIDALMALLQLHNPILMINEALLDYMGQQCLNHIVKPDGMCQASTGEAVVPA